MSTGATTTTDVVVLCARAAGAATAMLLARAGLSVAVVDRDRPGADTLSTHALMRGGVTQLARWGLLDDVVRSGAPAIRRTTFRYPDGDVPVAIKPAGGVDALYAPRRTVLDPLLTAAAAAAGATVHHGIRVGALRRDATGQVCGVDGQDADGHDRSWSARLVVGADGRRSTVARLAGAPTTHAGRHSSAFVYGYWHDLDADGYEWGYGPGASCGFIPTNDGATCVFAGGSPDRVGRGGATVLRALLAAASPSMGARLERATAPLGTRTFTGQPGYLRRPWGPGWALVGDAGSWKDPASAHGLTDALRDAELLARAVVDGWDGDDGLALRRYELVRDRLTRPILDASDEIGTHRWDMPRITELLWAMSEAMTAELEVITAFDERPIGATPVGGT